MAGNSGHVRIGARAALVLSALLPFGGSASALSARTAPAGTPRAGALLVARAEEPPRCVQRMASMERVALWAPPLDRIVSAQLDDASVRDAIDHVARQAGLEISYSTELLPATRRVCLRLERVTAGAVLDLLLDGSAIRPIVLGSAQVVLAPTREVARTDGMSTGMPTMARRASVLDRVVVTGTPDGAAQRGSPFALDVIDGSTLAQHGATSLGDALDLAIPGLWTWSNTAGTVTARYGSIRGASSFGISTPKVYLDGIEVANPLLVTQLDPSRVARVEVIRGPQGAALYGADAISGVVNILTRHDGTPDGGTRLQVASRAGMSATTYAPRDPFVQDHAVSLRRGSSANGFGLGFNVGTTGAYVPGASERRVLADGSVRHTGARSVWTGTARVSHQQANASTGLMLSAIDATVPAFGGDSAGGQRATHYTVGAQVAVMPSLHWTHTAIVGLDGFRLQGLSPLALPGPLTAATALAVSSGEGAAERGSLRYRAAARLDPAPQTTITVSVGADQAFTRDATSTTSSLVSPGPTDAGSSTKNGNTTGVPGLAGPSRTPMLPPMTSNVLWYANTGLWSQGQLAWRDQWFVSGGIRLERTSGATPNTQHAVLPMLGVAYVRDVAGVVVKGRGAYGRGIRPARTTMRSASWMGRPGSAALAELEPESQQGIELGADLLVGTRAALRVTRFDQTASGLIQPVSGAVRVTGATGRLQRAMSFSLQNVGAIANRGWEVDGNVRTGALTVAASWSQVDSRVLRTAASYRGELRVGDRMLDVPATVATMTVAWQRGRWTLASGASRAADWIGYDRLAIASALANTETASRDFEGAQLRRYWTAYDAVTRWYANSSVRLRGDLALVISGDNLLNVQRGAPDNASVIAGRTLTLGVRTTF